MIEGALYASYEVHDNNILIDSQYENILDKSYVCHFFDEDTEYRMIIREARDDVIRLLITHEQEVNMNEDLLFSEDVLVSPAYLIASNLPDKIRIVNRYKYSDNDTLVLDNYRIASTCKK